MNQLANITTMKKIFIAALLLSTSSVFTQTPPATSFAKSMGLYVFPGKNQTKEVQEKDDTDCYKWAVEQSGVDPLNPHKGGSGTGRY